MIDANLEDTPYQVVKRLSATELELQYGNTTTHERWRLARLPNVTLSTYRIKIKGRWYRFAGRLK